jgi:hypothetical protein
MLKEGLTSPSLGLPLMRILMWRKGWLTLPRAPPWRKYNVRGRAIQSFLEPLFIENTVLVEGSIDLGLNLDDNSMLDEGSTSPFPGSPLEIILC